MKNATTITLALVLVVTIATGYLFYRNNANDDHWNERINHYGKVSDSLQNELNAIDARLQKKDSMLLFYMASLDRTLEELNKESNKNKETIKQNFSKQDSILAEYCRQMVDLDQKPEGCK
jgi:peptidoglycan hydrolase CwlO-like protein